VDECFELQLGKMSSRKAREGREQTSYIKNNNVLWDRFVLEGLPRMSFSDVERRKFSLRAGDILVCEGGEIGRSAIWADVPREIVYQKALHRLRPRDGDVLSRFFLHYLRYLADTGELAKIATGTTILHLPQERLGALRLPFPDRDTQVSIVAQLDSVVRAAAQARERVKEQRLIKSMLMERILAG
jgi:type I restriction enzyme S subunit